MNKQHRLKLETKTKKWSFNETISLLDYLKKNPNLEKPSAAIYYGNLIAATNIKVNALRWDLLQNKVRQLKAVYIKTENWISLMSKDVEGGDCLSQDEIQVQVKKMCPHFARLRNIFGKAETHEETIDDRFLDAFLASSESEDEEAIPEQPTTLPRANTECVDGVTELDLDPKTSITNVPAAPVQETQKALLRLEWKRLQFERYKFNKLYEMKKLQIDRDYELKKWALTQKARQTRYELEKDDVFLLS